MISYCWFENFVEPNICLMMWDALLPFQWPLYPCVAQSHELWTFSALFSSVCTHFWCRMFALCNLVIVGDVLYTTLSVCQFSFPSDKGNTHFCPAPSHFPHAPKGIQSSSNYNQLIKPHYHTHSKTARPWSYLGASSRLGGTPLKLGKPFVCRWWEQNRSIKSKLFSKLNLYFGSNYNTKGARTKKELQNKLVKMQWSNKKNVKSRNKHKIFARL